MGKAPRVVVSGIVVKDGKILLVKEVLEDKKESWIFPGGGVRFGEKLEHAVKREIKEGTGLDVDVKEFLGFHEAVFPDYDYHALVLFYIVVVRKGKLRLREKKILEARYFDKKQLSKLRLVSSAKWALERLRLK